MSAADVERGRAYDDAAGVAREEEESLLPVTTKEHGSEGRRHSSGRRLGPASWSYVAAAFVAGVASCAALQYAFGIGCAQLSGARPPSQQVDTHDGLVYLAPEHAGKTVVHDYPPAHPTNSKPEFFPTNVGYAGPTPTGAEAALVATAPAYPMKTEIQNLLGPTSPPAAGSKKDFDMFKYWGNLSPWYSIPKGGFGVDSTPEAPDGCRVTALHFVHRHGARYPTSWASYGGPVKFASRLHKEAAGWDASGDLAFLNDWTYKLGGEILTPFGRQQMFDLGISLRIKYGFLLENSTAQNALPVFRTESQDRMLHSALNFAAGFFGVDYHDKYLQSITIEADGFNNTLCPYKTCPNARDPTKSDRAIPYVKEWTAIYLKDAQKRLQPQLKGFDLTIEDVYIMQQTCAYETVALGYSSFCELFTQDEWEGFEYALDLYFWYDSAFGAPTSRVQGIGYVQELVARLTETPIPVHNSSTNATLDDNPITFPLGHSLYVDATHEVVVLNIITALNLSNFAVTGPLPSDHIPENRSFISSQLAPFGTNIQFQVLSCEAKPEPQLRIIVNDGVSPLTGIKGCAKDAHGMCAVPTFVDAMREIIAETDWNYDCHAAWSVPPGPAWNTTTGDPPK